MTVRKVEAKRAKRSSPLSQHEKNPIIPFTLNLELTEPIYVTHV